MSALEKMIAEMKAEHDAQWDATRKNQGALIRKTEWATQEEAMRANPGFSFRAFWQNATGNWCCA